MYTTFNAVPNRKNLRTSSLAINLLNDGEIGGETYGLRLLISQIEPPAALESYCFLYLTFAEAEDLMVRLGRAIGYQIKEPPRQ